MACAQRREELDSRKAVPGQCRWRPEGIRTFPRSSSTPATTTSTTSTLNLACTKQTTMATNAGLCNDLYPSLYGHVLGVLVLLSHVYLVLLDVLIITKSYTASVATYLEKKKFYSEEEQLTKVGTTMAHLEEGKTMAYPVLHNCDNQVRLGCKDLKCLDPGGRFTDSIFAVYTL